MILTQTLSIARQHLVRIGVLLHYSWPFGGRGCALGLFSRICSYLQE